MASRDLSDLDIATRKLCNSFLGQCSAKGLRVRIDCTYRSDEEQDMDYAQGRTAPGRIITQARAGQSPHNCTLSDGTPAARAFDIYVENEDGSLNWDATSAPWQQVAAIGRALGLVWGGSWKGSFKDKPHFELANWKS